MSVGPNRVGANAGWIARRSVLQFPFDPPIGSLDEFLARATIRPVPGQLVLLAGLLFHATWVMVAVTTYRSRRGADRARPPSSGKDAVLELARGG